MFYTAQAPDEHHVAVLHRSASPEGERGRSVSPMAAHRESQEFHEEDVAQIMQGKPSPDKGSPIPSHQAHNDSVDRSGSFHAENNTTPVRQRTTSGGSYHQSSGMCEAVIYLVLGWFFFQPNIFFLLHFALEIYLLAL